MRRLKTIILSLLVCMVENCLYGQSIMYINGITIEGHRYTITGDVDLKGKELKIPENVELFFDGGSISNGTVTLNKNHLGGTVNIKTEISGSIVNDEINLSWFGVNVESNSDQSKRVQQVLDLYEDNVPHNSWDINLLKPEPCVVFPAGRFYLGEIKLRSYLTIRGQGRGSTELRGVQFTAEGRYNINIEDLSVFGNYSSNSKNNFQDGSAFLFKDCGRLLFKNIAVRNYRKAFDFYNTVLSDFYSCYVSYCDIGFCNDGSGSGYGGHALRWYGGEICNCQIGFSQRMGNSVSFIGSSVEHCMRAFELIYPVSFTINSCYFEANEFDIWGNIVHTNIEDCFFSDAHKSAGGTYIYAESIGLSVIRGNKFNRQIGNHPYIETKEGATYYHNLAIVHNDMVGGGRIIVSNLIKDAIEERGVIGYQQYLPNGNNMLMGQVVLYKDSKTDKYYLVTRDESGKLLYIPATHIK